MQKLTPAVAEQQQTQPVIVTSSVSQAFSTEEELAEFCVYYFQNQDVNPLIAYAAYQNAPESTLGRVWGQLQDNINALSNQRHYTQSAAYEPVTLQIEQRPTSSMSNALLEQWRSITSMHKGSKVNVWTWQAADGKVGYVQATLNNDIITIESQPKDAKDAVEATLLAQSKNSPLRICVPTREQFGIIDSELSPLFSNNYQFELLQIFNGEKMESAPLQCHPGPEGVRLHIEPSELSDMGIPLDPSKSASLAAFINGSMHLGESQMQICALTNGQWRETGPTTEELGQGIRIQDDVTFFVTYTHQDTNILDDQKEQLISRLNLLPAHEMVDQLELSRTMAP